jgi:hypothetical protein
MHHASTLTFDGCVLTGDIIPQDVSEKLLSEKGPIAGIKSEVQQAQAEQEQGKNEQQDKEKTALQMVLSLPHPSAPEIMHVRPQALPVWSLIGIWYTHAGKA